MKIKTLIMLLACCCMAVAVYGDTTKCKQKKDTCKSDPDKSKLGKNVQPVVVCCPCCNASKETTTGTTAGTTPPKTDPCKSKDTASKIDTSKWGWEWLLVFSPLILFAILLWPFLYLLRGFDLLKALTENSPSQVIEKNPLYDLENLNKLLTPNQGGAAASMGSILPPTITVSTKDDFRPSTSRLIAFMTAILALVLGISLSCFTIYCNLGGKSAPDIGQLSALLAALGIGTVPYAFNKVSTAISNNKTPT